VERGRPSENDNMTILRVGCVIGASRRTSQRRLPLGRSTRNAREMANRENQAAPRPTTSLQAAAGDCDHTAVAEVALAVNFTQKHNGAALRAAQECRRRNLSGPSMRESRPNTFGLVAYKRPPVQF